jgi:acylglycerol lipase
MVTTAELLPLTSADGTELAAYRWRAEPSKATLVLLHGYCDHAGRYPELVEAALANGYSVAAVDLRGHGGSKGQPGHAESFSHYLDDLEALVRAVEADAGPMFLAAHSMGALTAIRYLQSGRRGSFRGLVTSSPYLGLAMQVPLWKRAAATLLSRLWPAFSMPTGIPIEELSRSEEAVRRTRADAQYGKLATARAYIEQLAAHVEAFAHAGALRLPVLMLVAGADRIASAEAARLFHGRLGSRDRQLVLLEGMYHEIFADPEREERIFALLFPWLEQRLPVA